MIARRPAAERGVSDFGWLLSRHSFSFGEYFDPARMGFGVLRVINDDRVAAGRGFPRHRHAEMEIFSYVLEGALTHKDSLGIESTIRPGEVQKMSAGTGISHSEYNPSPSEPLHFLQVWIIPAQSGLPPVYEQREFPQDSKRNRLALIGSPDGRDGSIGFRQDVAVFASILNPARSVDHAPAEGRAVWVQVARGAIAVNGTRLDEGDAAAITGERRVRVDGIEDADMLLFDLPGTG